MSADRKTFTGEIGDIQVIAELTRERKRQIDRYLAKKHLPRWLYFWMRLRRKV